MARELCITIPCEPGKVGEHLNGPIYIYDGSNSMAAYKCPHCGQTGPRIKPLRNHMGLTMNIPAGCPVLKAQDEARRADGKRGKIKQEGSELSDELWMLREQAKINAQS